MTEGRKRRHIPVMAEEIIEYLMPQEGDTYLDGTLGLAGHARLVADVIGPTGRCIGIDRDPNALAEAGRTLAEAPCPVTLIHGSYSEMAQTCQAMGISDISRILLDLGVSSLQLDTPERGFSFRFEAPLDMRMNPEQPLTAEEVVNRWPEKELADILRDLGEERYWRQLARRIAEVRRQGTIHTTGELASLVRDMVPRRGKIDPATRTFQAIRMAVNDELGEIDRGLAAALSLLKPGGRLAVITFHSLEDRPTKYFLRRCKTRKLVTLVNKKVITPRRDECRRNRRSRSAKLRVCERTDLPWPPEGVPECDS